MKARTLKTAGFVLLLAATIGYLTVADDPRHFGEFFAVSGILISGVALLLAGYYPRLGSVLALQWLAFGIGISTIVGTIVDRVVLGVCFGIALGLLSAYLFRRREIKLAEPSPN